MYSLQSETHKVYVGVFFIFKIHTFLIHLDSRKENVRPFSGDFYLSDDNASLQRPAGLCAKGCEAFVPRDVETSLGVTGREMEEMGNVGA